MHEVLSSPGKPLDAGTRRFMESRFPQDFTRVQAHGSAPQRAAQGLEVGEADDTFEQEADRVAARVMKSEPQDAAAGAKMDFSRVRIHTGAKAAESAQKVNALAYTVGNDVVFGAGQYAPETSSGRALLAHELTHVLQQQGGAHDEAEASPVVRRKARSRIPVLSDIYDFFSNIAQAISPGFSPDTLQEYLDTIIETGKIEDSSDSDNKALEVFKLWKAGKDKREIKVGARVYRLDDKLKKLLSAELRTGSVGDDEKLAAQELDAFSPQQAAAPQSTPAGPAATTTAATQPAESMTDAEKGAAKIREGLKGQLETVDFKGKKFQVGGVKANKTAQNDIKTNNVLLNKEDTAHIEFINDKLGVDIAYSTPRDPFRWGVLKEIIATGKVDILAVSEDEEFWARDAMRANIGEKEKKTLKSMPRGGARGATAEREGVYKLTAASNPPGAISLVSVTDSDQVYYSTGFASLAHEFFGHLWLAMNGVPSGHQESLQGTHTIKDPFGEPFVGSVNDYIALFVQESPKEQRGKPINPPSASLDVSDANFEAALKGFIQAASAKDAFNNKFGLVGTSRDFQERWKALERFYKLLLLNQTNEGKRLGHIITEIKKVYDGYSEEFREDFDVTFFFRASSPGTGLTNPEGHIVSELKIQDPRQRPQKKGKVQPAATAPYTRQYAPPIVHEVLAAPGQPLDAGTRNFMESRFHQDFSHVRVHTDARAARSARAINALAYTMENNLVFAPGQYRPQTLEGKRLLAHELTHVIQQRGVGHHAGAQPSLRVSERDDPAEREADAMAKRVLTPNPAPTLAPSSQAKASPFTPIIAPTLAWPASPKLKTGFEPLGAGAPEVNQKTVSRVENACVYRQAEKADDEPGAISLSSLCAPEQDSVILAAAKGGLEWLEQAITKLDAFLAKPKDAGNAAVSDALKTHFKSTDVKVAKYIRGQLNLIRSEIKSLKSFRVECPGSADKECAVAAAYVPDAAEKVVFCDLFFKSGAYFQKGAIVHELAHAQVGGAHITDRAYESDRAAKQLTTEESLTNAESYMLIARQLGTGKAIPLSLPVDTQEDCPPEWTSALEKALASAQRWNREAQVPLATLAPKNLSEEESKLIGGKTQAAVDLIRAAVDKLASLLGSPVNFECDEECDGGAFTDWYSIWSDLHICPAWAKANSDDQALFLLEGLYGYAAGVKDSKLRLGYAKYARKRRKEAPPSLSTMLGSAAWNADYLEIRFKPIFPLVKPKASIQQEYIESGTLHQRMSKHLPRFQSEPCQATPLTFAGGLFFYVDKESVPRPAPFTPPRLSAEFQYPSTSGSAQKSQSASRGSYDKPGEPLDMEFPYGFNFTITKNGPLKMKLQLQDPDTGITRVYEDTIQVEPEMPCNAPKGGKK